MLLPILNIDKAAGSQDQFTKSIYNILESIGINVSLLSLIILLVIIFMFKGVSVFLQNTFASYIRFSLAKDIRIDFCNKYKDMKYGYYTNTSIGYLNNIITTEIDRGVAALNKYTVVVGSLIFILIYLALLLLLTMR